MEIKDKIVVITGASRGLGKSLALEFAKNGAKIVANSRKAEDLKEVSQETKGLCLAADMTKEKEVLEMAQQIVGQFGRIDIWVNNAGLWMPHSPIEDMDWGRVHDLMEVNVFGTIYGSKAALLQMKKQKGGAIVNIISTSGLVGRPQSSGYCATKFAAAGFTKSLREEVRCLGISTVAVYPGGMKTELFGDKKPEEFAGYMDPAGVAKKIVDNLKKDNPDEEFVVRSL